MNVDQERLRQQKHVKTRQDYASFKIHLFLGQITQRLSMGGSLIFWGCFVASGTGCLFKVGGIMKKRAVSQVTPVVNSDTREAKHQLQEEKAVCREKSAWIPFKNAYDSMLRKWILSLHQQLDRAVEDQSIHGQFPKLASSTANKRRCPIPSAILPVSRAALA